MKRVDRFGEVCRKIGPGSIQIENAYDGWPGTVVSHTRDQNFLLALHVSSVSSHSRRDYELRFQNPGQNKPVEEKDGGYPFLLGDANDILIIVNGMSRVGRNTRFSILFPTSLVSQARSNGWSEYTSNSGETIIAFKPVLFDLAVSRILDGEENFDDSSIVNIFNASGYSEDDANSDERIRKPVNAIVRNRMFSKKIKFAYNNKCAMCGIDCGVVVGAHIYPASAPGSADIVTNGLALCQNHHTVFDNHRLWVNPENGEIHFHESLVDEARISQAAQVFIDSTHDVIDSPNEEFNRPSSEMFRKRYEHFNGKYEWLSL